MITKDRPFIWKSIVVESSKNITIDITYVTNTVEIWESLEKPYLTGTIEFVDESNIYSDFGFEGAEKITIQFRGKTTPSTAFTKSFFVSKVLRVSRANPNTQSVVLHLIEDIAYIANLQNVNKVYTGTTSEIITKIANNYLNKSIGISDTDTNTIKTIIPNLDPIEAMMWLRNDATTTDGYPFYLFSTLVENYLTYADLGSMITAQPINKNEPYVFNESVLSLENPDFQSRNLTSYDIVNIENLFDLIKKGYVGSNLEITEILNGNQTNLEFNVVKDALYTISQNLTKEQSEVNYYPLNVVQDDTNTLLSGKYFSQLKSKNISQIAASKVFDIGSVYYPAYGEKPTVLEHKRHLISRALQNFLHKSSLQFSVDGARFVDGSQSNTIGNTLRVLFSNTKNSDNRPYDNKISGDYLVYEAHHIFKVERYDVKFTGVKLANYKK